ncbi:hypothetical protein [uncultured Nitrosomonas sp.]|uniref:hypothetical protein n=1 Tax=uncultured Nitrosomonas sp. TaxID=156424 RepID=UPI0025DBF11B|nr:hypothetical protein [uncultured Nitrosomonas sp.]
MLEHRPKIDISKIQPPQSLPKKKDVYGGKKTFDAPDAPDASSRGASVKSTGQSIDQVIPVSNKFPQNLPQKFDLYLNQHGIAHATMKTSGNPLALPVGSKQLNNIIRNIALDEGKTLRNLDIKFANEYLVGHAETIGIVKPVWYRVAPFQNGIELDVGDKLNSRILVTPDSVEVITQDSNTLFNRTPTSRPMVMPADKSDISRLFNYLNLTQYDQFLLLVWLCYTLAHPKMNGINYVILLIQGDQGTGKTSLCNNIILRLIDPNVIGTQVFPNNAKDLAIASQHSHVLCFDNMRNFKASMSDNLCMAATGGTITNRALYTDSDQHVSSLHGAIVLNGIHSFINQADLAQRCLPIRTLPLSESDRVSEAVMLKRLEDDLPLIFRGLLEMTSDMLKCLPDVKITHPERMLDFVHWLAAFENVVGMRDAGLQRAYSSALRQIQLDSLMENPLATAIYDFVDKTEFTEWSGTPQALLAALNLKSSLGTSYSRDWPNTPISLSKRLKALDTSLKTQGIIIEFGRGNERKITIKKVGKGND